MTPRCDSAAPRPVRRAVKRRRSAGSSLSPHPPDAGSAGSSAAGRPAGTGKSLLKAKGRVKGSLCWRGGAG